MGNVIDPQSLFLYKLGDVYAAEKIVEKILPKMQKEAHVPELAQGYGRHLEETRQQIQNIEKVFEALGEKPKATRSPVMEGLKTSYEEFAAEVDDAVTPDVLDLFATGATVKTEHVEIAAYTSLIAAAEAMGQTAIVELLRANLAQEQKMLVEVEALAKRLLQQAVREPTTTV